MSDGPPDWFDRYHGFEHEPANIIEITGEIRATTDRAVQFYDGSVTTWLPRSLIEIADNVAGLSVVSLPEWLARKNGLI